MAKKLIRYLLEGDGSVPLFVEDGGYCLLGAELVGRSVDETQRHVPSTVHRMTRLELIERYKTLCKDDQGSYINDRDGNPYSDEICEGMAESLLQQLGLEDIN